LYITENCTLLIDEFPGYEWKEAVPGENDKEQPKKFNDHALDALRYFIFTHWDVFSKAEKPEPEKLPTFLEEVAEHTENLKGQGLDWRSI
jgi:hypothetical protein